MNFSNTLPRQYALSLQFGAACDTAYNYQSAHILSLETALPATQPIALDALPISLSDPIVCDFGQLFQLDIVLAAQA
ncbi:hypothetical protein EDB83DRAFT_2521488 [Lactarius deliciosus]|nr:hypothetical protein EDB83DRAFT_2521488 [Lactarius deliciosus]